MKFKNPKRQIRRASWSRITPPSNEDRDEFIEKLRAHKSTGLFWYNHIYTHWWVEKESDVLWIELIR